MKIKMNGNMSHYTIETNITLSDFLIFEKYILRKQMKSVEVIVMMVSGALLINSLEPFNLLMFIAPLLIIILFYLFIPYKSKRSSTNAYKSILSNIKN